jgi:hypothetical protein
MSRENRVRLWYSVGVSLRPKRRYIILCSMRCSNKDQQIRKGVVLKLTELELQCCDWRLSKDRDEEESTQ